MTSKKRLEIIGRKLASRVNSSLRQTWVAQFLELHKKGLIRTKDGRTITQQEWVDSQPEPLRSMLKELADGKDLSE